MAPPWPAMARKGRIQVGKDADITVLDPAMVIDNARFRDPYASRIRICLGDP